MHVRLDPVHKRQLNHFHLSCLHKLLKIRWEDGIPDTEVLCQAITLSVYTLVHKAQIRWSGPFTECQTTTSQSNLFMENWVHGRCLVGGQKKRFKDTSKVTLKDFFIMSTLSKLQQRSAPRGAISSPQGLFQMRNTEHWPQ